MLESGKPNLMQIIRARNIQCEEVPDGWKTSNEYAVEWNVARGTACKYLKNALEMGLVEQKKFRIVSSGTIQHVPHYKEIIEGKRKLEK